MTYGLDTMIAEVQRECAMRLKVYPRQVEQKRMTPEQMDERIGVMQDVLHTLLHLREVQSAEAKAHQLARDGAL